MSIFKNEEVPSAFLDPKKESQRKIKVHLIQKKRAEKALVAAKRKLDFDKLSIYSKNRILYYC